jgi:hypothetical protein
MNQLAFPQSNDRVVGSLSIAKSQGMTLRDYFAAKAMTGLLTAEIVGEYSNEHVAEIAYRIADAMLKARET